MIVCRIIEIIAYYIQHIRFVALYSQQSEATVSPKSKDYNFLITGELISICGKA